MKSQAYEICVDGRLDIEWRDWFEGFTIVHDEHGRSTLTGTIKDQAELHGLLNKIRNLGLVLLSVNIVQ